MISFQINVGSFENEMARVERAVLAGAHTGLAVGLASFEKAFLARRLTKRTDDSISPRTGRLRAAFRSEVERSPASVAGRVGFLEDAGELVGKIAATHERGAVIRPKRAKFLRFTLHRRYARGPWPFPEDTKEIFARKVTIPPRLHFEDDFTRAAPDLIQRVDRSIDARLAAEGLF